MSELLICINLVANKKKSGYIFETYVTSKIRKLNSKQFSGQKRKIDIDLLKSVNNISDTEFVNLKKLLHKRNNIQINYYQFLIESNNISTFQTYIDKGYFFYNNGEGHIYNIEKLDLKYLTDTDKQNILYVCNKSYLNLNIIIQKINHDTLPIIANLYINLSNKKYEAELFFEYEKQEINYIDKKNEITEKIIRDYSFEKNIIWLLNANGWHVKNTGYFEYIGKEITDSLSILRDNDINIYTSQEHKKIVIGKPLEMSLSYNMDWFELKGRIQFDNKNVNLQDILNLKMKSKEWVMLNGEIAFLPKILLKNKDILKKDKETIRIEKKYIGQLLSLSQEMGIHSIQNIHKLTDYSKIRLNINIHLFSILKDYQKIGVKWLLYLYKNNFGGCLCDDMGLGKTIQILAYLSASLFDKTCNLIIVPKTLLENWKREILKFLPDIKFYIYHHLDRDIEQVKKHRIILTTYAMIINDFDQLVKINYANIIIDEAQNIKNSRTKAYTFISKLKSSIKIVLTGTPFENNINELFALMDLTNPGVFSHVKKSILQNEDETKRIGYIKRMISPFVLRRIKTDVLKDLPAKYEQTIYCTMDEDQKELYKTILASIQYEIKRKPAKYEIKSNSILLEGLLHLQQVCCHPKLLPRNWNLKHCIESIKTTILIDMLKKLLSNNHKVVVFSRFTSMLQIIQKQLIHNEILYFYLDGKTSNRFQVVDDFEYSEKSVFLVSLKAGGVGLNLTSADTVIIYDPWWNPAVEKQAEDRIYRIGQKQNITVYRLIVSNTIEEKIEDLKTKKKDIATKILDGEDTVVNIDINLLKNLILEEI